MKNIEVYFSKFAEKQIRKLPLYIQEKVYTWRKAYRLIYEIDDNSNLTIIIIMEINKHDY